MQRAEPATGTKPATTADPSSVAWASAGVKDLNKINAAVSTTRSTMRSDAKNAVSAYEGVQKSFADFETKFRTAHDAFENGVKSAKAESKAVEDALMGAVELVLFAYTGPFGLAATRAGKLVERLDLAKDFVERTADIGKLGKAGLMKAGVGGGGATSKSDHHWPDEIDWNALVGRVLDTFRKDIEKNSTIDEISDSVTASLKFLNDVRAGGGPADPQSTADGKQAQTILDNQKKLDSELYTIRTLSIAEPAREFAAAVKKQLGGRTHLQLQQEITIKWIAGLAGSDLDEIDEAEGYLRKINLIDVSGNKFNYDTGWMTTDVDEKLIQFIARSEATAMDLVGTGATWLGSLFAPPPPRYYTRRGPLGREMCVEGPPVTGLIRDNRNREWRAIAPPGTSTEGGGSVDVVSYKVELGRDYRNKWTSYGRKTIDSINNEVVFMVRPRGSTGGGAPPAPTIIFAAD